MFLHEVKSPEPSISQKSSIYQEGPYQKIQGNIMPYTHEQIKGKKTELSVINATGHISGFVGA